MLEIIIVGHIGSARFVKAGDTHVLNLSIASSRRIRDREFTDWVSAKVWGERAEKLREHIAVGMKLLLRGRPEARGFLKNDGTVTGELVLHVLELEFLSGKSKSAQDEQLSLEAPSAPKAKKQKAGAK